MPIVGIPTVQNGTGILNNGFDNLMKQIFERQQLAQQKQLQEAQNSQREREFQGNLGLRQQSENRASQLFPLQLQAMKDAHMKASPDFQAQQFKAMVNALGGGEINEESMKKNPMLRGFFKSKFGFDPLANAPQTPEEKETAALDLFKKKEDIKANRKGGDNPTNTILTQNQQAAQAIDTVLPMIDEFINNPDKVYGLTDFSRSKKASYEAKTGGMIDTLIAAQTLPKVQASIDLVEKQIRRQTGESVDDYIKRLGEFKSDLLNRRDKSQSVIQSRKVNTSPMKESNDYSKMSDAELLRIAGGK